MAPAAIRNDRGMTLIEILFAMVVLLIASLAMLQTGLVSMQTNVVNALRDEAVSVAEAKMNEIRNIPFAGLTDTGSGGAAEPSVERRYRATSVTYTVRRYVDTVATDAKQVTVTVQWTYRGTSSSHTITSLIRRST